MDRAGARDVQGVPSWRCRLRGRLGCAGGGGDLSALCAGRRRRRRRRGREVREWPPSGVHGLRVPPRLSERPQERGLSAPEQQHGS